LQQPFVPIPQPFGTLRAHAAYGPSGHISFREEIRMAKKKLKKAKKLSGAKTLHKGGFEVS
jgi:hypothetical protein